MAKFGLESNCDTLLVVAGVRFIGDFAKVLSPEKSTNANFGSIMVIRFKL